MSEINIHGTLHLASTEEVFRVEGTLAKILNKLEHIMSAISDFAVKQQAHNDKVSADLDTLSSMIADLNAKIAALQAAPGVLTPADQASLDAIQASGAALEAKADALAGVVATPPTPPAA
jgi:phosphoglycerate-specific signal transduction histidine kinase